MRPSFSRLRAPGAVGLFQVFAGVEPTRVLYDDPEYRARLPAYYALTYVRTYDQQLPNTCMNAIPTLEHQTLPVYPHCTTSVYWDSRLMDRHRHAKMRP